MSTIVPMSMCTIVLMMAANHEHDRSQGGPILYSVFSTLVILSPTTGASDA
jgi:hypothetical protein